MKRRAKESLNTQKNIWEELKRRREKTNVNKTKEDSCWLGMLLCRRGKEIRSWSFNVFKRRMAGWWRPVKCSNTKHQPLSSSSVVCLFYTSFIIIFLLYLYIYIFPNVTVQTRNLTVCKVKLLQQYSMKNKKNTNE